MRLPVNRIVVLSLVLALGGCGLGGGRGPAASAPLATSGPAADYPVTIGAPFTIAGVTHTPIDRMNYDDVGYASVDQDGGGAISGSHKTLPLPSYVEVTSLESGKTVLVRLERRGPMDNDHLVELSPGAAAQLGIAGTPRASVRVRRVNPPESERALLRSGERAPERMDTPKPLLSVLSRRLPATSASLPVPVPEATSQPDPIYTPSTAPVSVLIPSSLPEKADAPAKPISVSQSGDFTVQVAAFSSQDRATALAQKIGGRTEPAGQFWRVRVGPFRTRAQAQPVLAKIQAQGYKDARIVSVR